MTYLFLDTSSSTLILSLLKDDKEIDKIILENSKEHSIYAVSKLSEILNRNKLEPKDIDRIFVTVGPGSFTGIRIGVTIAKTYAYCLNKKITPISSLKMKILEYSGYDNYVSIIKDKRDLVYLGIYDKDYNTVFEGLISNSILQEKLNDLSNYKLVESENDDVDRKNLNVLKVIEYYKNQKDINPHEVNPIYLKEVI